MSVGRALKPLPVKIATHGLPVRELSISLIDPSGANIFMQCAMKRMHGTGFGCLQDVVFRWGKRNT